MFGQKTGDVVLPVDVSSPIPDQALAFHGAIGVGSNRADVEYKDIEVTSAGLTLYRSDFSAGAAAWTGAAGAAGA